jgi:hypothetical protein
MMGGVFLLPAMGFSLCLVWILGSLFVLSTLEVNVDLSFGSVGIKYDLKNRFETKTKE